MGDPGNRHVDDEVDDGVDDYGDGFVNDHVDNDDVDGNVDDLNDDHVDGNDAGEVDDDNAGDDVDDLGDGIVAESIDGDVDTDNDGGLRSHLVNGDVNYGGDDGDALAGLGDDHVSSDGDVDTDGVEDDAEPPGDDAIAEDVDGDGFYVVDNLGNYHIYVDCVGVDDAGVGGLGSEHVDGVAADVDDGDTVNEAGDIGGDLDVGAGVDNDGVAHVVDSGGVSGNAGYLDVGDSGDAGDNVHDYDVDDDVDVLGDDHIDNDDIGAAVGDYVDDLRGDGVNDDDEGVDNEVRICCWWC